MLIVREINGDQSYEPEVVSHSEDFETARLELVEWLTESSASDAYTDAVLADFDKIDVNFDSIFEHSNGAQWSDRYEWLCASTANTYMAA